jgi:hypothetical protein
MALSSLPWAVGAVAALLTGLVVLARSFRGSRRGHAPDSPALPVWCIVSALAVLVAVVTGLAWRAFETGVWPGGTVADALAMLAGGALASVIWVGWRNRAYASWSGHGWAVGSVLILVAVGLGLAVALSWGIPAGASPDPRAWVFMARSLLAGVGLGGWVLAAASSIIWSVARRPAAAERPSGISAPRVAAGDPGRVAALVSYPWLTAAWLVAGAWNLMAHAAAWRAAPAELWLLAAWLLGAAYLHLTSTWRPLRLPAWLPAILAVLVVVAAVCQALTTGLLLIAGD